LSDIRKELRKSKDFTARTTTRANQARTIQIIYKLIKNIK
jgi:hypothetical protein